MGIGVIGSTEIGRGVRQGSRMSHILFNLYGEYLMNEALTEVGEFNIGGKIINKVRFADDKAKIQAELQDMVNRLVDTGNQHYKSQVMRVSRSNKSLHIKVNNRELKEVDHFKYLGSVLKRDGYRTREIKMRVAIVEEALKRKISQES
jgi:Reverse transcriptase (RNA-dependent DNA polymerase).